MFILSDILGIKHSQLLEEAKIRAKLHKRLNRATQRALHTVKVVQETYGDTVTYCGREYLDKIQHDKYVVCYYSIYNQANTN